MTTFAHLRKNALSFPDAAEHRTDANTVAFTSGNSPFATACEGLVELLLPDQYADQLLAKHPTAERLSTNRVRFPLRNLNGQQLNYWLRRAWRFVAPDDLARQASAADSAVAGEVGDLPRAIGNPATRALVGAGISRLSQLTERTEAELKALHGVGPRAIRILKEALRANGRQLRD